MTYKVSSGTLNLCSLTHSLDYKFPSTSNLSRPIFVTDTFSSALLVERFVVRTTFKSVTH